MHRLEPKLYPIKNELMNGNYWNDWLPPTLTKLAYKLMNNRQIPIPIPGKCTHIQTPCGHIVLCESIAHFFVKIHTYNVHTHAHERARIYIWMTARRMACSHELHTHTWCVHMKRMYPYLLHAQIDGIASQWPIRVNTRYIEHTHTNGQ